MNLVSFALIVLLGGQLAEAVRPPAVLTSKQKLIFASNETIQVFWRNLTSRLDGWVDQQFSPIVRRWNAEVRETTKRLGNISQPCLEVVEFMIRNPLRQEWVARMIDASARLPSGIMSGTTTSLGDFDQCLAIEAMHQDRQFVGKYCLATLGLPRRERFDKPQVDRSRLHHAWLGDYFEQWHNNDNFYALAHGVCFPSICSAGEVRELLLAYYEPLKQFDFNVTFCQSIEEPSPFDLRIWVALSIFLLPCVVVVLATLVDVLGFNEKSPVILRAFSLPTNVHNLFQIVEPLDPNTRRFQFVHGIRAIASILILLAHTGALIPVPTVSPVQPLARYPNDMQAIAGSLLAQPFYNGGLIVFVFLLLSGMFTVYTTISRQKLAMPYWQFMALRWLRFAPMVVGLICLTMCMELFGHGPLFHHDIIWPNVRQCYEGWWQNLLFVNNFQDFDQACNLHTWYIAVDMQMHALAFILLLVYLRSSRATYWTSVGMIGAGTASLFLVVNVLKLCNLTRVQTLVFTENTIPNNSIKYIAFAPWSQMIAYFTGTLLGLAILEKRRLRLSPTTHRLLWTLAVFFVFTIPIASYFQPLNAESVVGPSDLASATAFALALLLWTSAHAWFIYQCYAEPSNPLARFLSAPLFQPFSRLSFSFYLVHLLTIWYNVLQTRSPLNYASFHELIKNAIFSIIQSFMLGVLLHVTFEAPSINLIKLLIRRGERSAVKVRKEKIPIDEINNNNIPSNDNVDEIHKQNKQKNDKL